MAYTGGGPLLKNRLFLLCFPTCLAGPLSLCKIFPQPRRQSYLGIELVVGIPGTAADKERAIYTSIYIAIVPDGRR